MAALGEDDVVVPWAPSPGVGEVGAVVAVPWVLPVGGGAVVAVPGVPPGEDVWVVGVVTGEAASTEVAVPALQLTVPPPTACHVVPEI